MAFLVSLCLVFAVSGCGQSVVDQDDLSGEVKIDGSSTVFLVSEAMASNFMREHPNVNISVGSSGTGGGFQKFAAGETDISDASRRIKAKEKKLLADRNIEWIELQIAWDGVSIVVNKKNTWARKMTVDQLRRIWHPGSPESPPAMKWSDVDSDWPDKRITLFGAADTSGTYDYFTDEICGQEGLCRRDYASTEDDNMLIKGVQDDEYAMGFVGYAYFYENRDALQAVKVATKKGEEYVEPSKENILTLTYQPLSRPLYIYVRKDSLERDEVREFVNFFVRRTDIVSRVGYVPLSSAQQYRERLKLKEEG
ncbi:MAG: PstS family phosphate ABC transporter substrate-binding protein [Gemmataceae bacterium]